MIYLASDIHGHIRLDYFKNIFNNLNLKNNDYLIITGDAGICWKSEQNPEVIEYYNSLGCIVLFVDGNHEDFDILNNLPIVNYLGGKAHKISDNIYHLMRGEIFNIDGKTFFCFGGAFSSKVLTNSSPIFVWKEELPTTQEYNNGIENLNKYNNQVDYILTHACPMSVVLDNGFNHYDNDDILLNYLECLKQKVSFKGWYYGHYHKDISKDKFTCIYNEVIKLEE